MLGYEEVLQRTARALNHFTAETGLNLKAEYFELRIHPADGADMMKTIPGSHAFRSIALDELRLSAIGFPIVEDPKIQEGAPKLVCTWEWVI